MTVMRKAVAVIVASFLSFAAFAAEPTTIELERAKYEQVLVPMYSIQIVAGANGSLWETEFTGRNGGASPALAFQRAGDGVEPTALASGQTFHIRPARDYQNPANPGVFIYVDKEHAATISFALRLREWSQPADFVELPIVRERDFSSTTTQLLEVPTSPATRVHLRLYGSSSPNGRGDVIVRIFSADNTKLFEQPLSLTPAGGLAAIPGPTAFSENPAYAELPNLTANFAGRGNVRVEIEPVTAGQRYWSFISVTNNATQRVSLITPQ
ncbi:MAG: hypothetical protein QOI24_277 [Acidobacteriota bacterium]|jgi:hypothetical protein|nr:hypothetical protein [Acidobacteriota bacterium]